MYCDMCLKLKDNKYFDKLRDIIELELANHSNNLNYIFYLLAIIKRISSSKITDYSKQFFELL